RALSVAHSAGIAHCDIKPENVMVREDGYVKVLDFGLARLTQRRVTGNNTVTNPGRLAGTVRYMSPEQARGEPPGVASDVFSLGLILYEIVAGRYPFTAESLLGALHAIATEAAAPPSRWNPEVSPALEQIILSMLEKNAASRPTAAEVEAALTRAADPPSRPRYRHNLPIL